MYRYEASHDESSSTSSQPMGMSTHQSQQMPQQRYKQQRKQRILCRACVLGAPAAGKTSILRRYFRKIFDSGSRVPTLGSDFYTGRIPYPQTTSPIIIQVTATSSEQAKGLVENNHHSDIGDGNQQPSPQERQQQQQQQQHQQQQQQQQQQHQISSTSWVSMQIWDTPGKERFVQSRRPRKRYTASFLEDSFFLHVDAIMLVYDMTSSTSFTQMLKWYADLMELIKDNPLPIVIVGNKLDLFRENQRRAPSFRPHKVPQRDVMGLQGRFRGDDFRYEYRVSPIPSSSSCKQLETGNHSEISYFLANRDNWTTDGSYLDSLLHSEDGSHPDREMVLLWCMRNGLQHLEVSAATGEGVDVAIETLVDLALHAKHSSIALPDQDGAESMGSPNHTNRAMSCRNQTLDIRSRYAPSAGYCGSALVRSCTEWLRHSS